jgi:hypothetical protein
MAAEFIGYNVLVTLRAPPDATVQGVVADVVGQRLMLRNGMYTSDNGCYWLCIWFFI